jgi:hypothetical protein
MTVPIDPRTATAGPSEAVRELRIRLAREDIEKALWPVSRDSESALNSIENTDDDGLTHHLRRVVECVKAAAWKHRELRLLLASEPTPAATVEPLGSRMGGDAV